MKQGRLLRKRRNNKTGRGYYFENRSSVDSIGDRLGTTSTANRSESCTVIDTSSTETRKEEKKIICIDDDVDDNDSVCASHLSVRTCSDDNSRQLHAQINEANPNQIAKKDKSPSPEEDDWSDEELKRLHRNILSYLESSCVRNMRSLKLPRTENDFWIKSRFILNMRRGIQRPHLSIQRKVFSEYSFMFRGGRLSKQKLKLLKTLENQYGKNWRRVYRTINRSDHSVVDQHKSYDSCFAPCSSNCTAEDAKLLSLLRDSGIYDECLVDWKDISEKFDGKFEPNELKFKFGCLSKQLPGWYLLGFEEKVDKLTDLYKSGTTFHPVAVSTAGDDDGDVVVIDSSSEDDIIFDIDKAVTR